MFRISKLTDYATVVLTLLAEQADGIHSASDLAARAKLEPPTVSKLLKMLGQAGLVESFRGASGGYRLARPAAQISVADIVTAMEGPIGVTECSLHDGLCDHETHCGVRANWRRISVAVEAALRSVTLADMLDPAPTRRLIPSQLSAH
ncbi:SUF system Fe-S cluster assembly regulator [Pseudomarimonas salicorniae]|uniref:SUF system Fe-S cluster assembly regulator n=1 Tax=Pseudomarimonas salicorniae TaxID=2933270 RepID=A0ABT0GDU9_9GAMM|nr:SUF system Fe-S cluster assembly regulator [Lysobacter sp. CAU 1642]MCK7592717.1 SUF system Fe-S cluster assembly regulator [Lysobacter sp. CAU 1642]